MMLNQPIDILVGLLRKWSIENIVSIDDGWKKDALEDVEVLFKLLLENYLDISEKISRETHEYEELAQIHSLIITTDLDDFKTLYDQLSAMDKDKLDKVIFSFDSSTSEFIATEESLSLLSTVLIQLKDAGFVVKSACEYSSLLRTGLGGKTLWLLDKEIKGDNTKVFEILELVVEHEDVALIITNNDTSISSRSQINDFVRDNFSRYQKLATSFLWVLRKDQITNGFMVSVKNVLQGVTLHNTLKVYNQLNDKIESVADERLRFIEPEDLDNFFRISYSEGSQVSDTLMRIRSAVMSEALHEVIKNETELAQLLLTNRELLEHLIIPHVPETTATEHADFVAVGNTNIDISNLSQDHKVVPIHSFEHWDYNINLLSYSSYTGDLFTKTIYNSQQNKWIPTKSTFLLITQPCDTILRETDGLIQRGTRVANLIKGEFLEYGSTSYRREIVENIANKIKVHFVRVNGKYGMVNFDLKNIHQIDFKILDLCSLDPYGDARLSMENMFRINYMASVSKKYYEEELRGFIDSLKNYNSASVETFFRKHSNGRLDMDQLKDAIQKEVQNVSIKNSIAVPKDIEFIYDKGFSISRIARLNDEYILNVIRQSTEYQGRQALPGMMF